MIEPHDTNCRIMSSEFLPSFFIAWEWWRRVQLTAWPGSWLCPKIRCIRRPQYNASRPLNSPIWRPGLTIVTTGILNMYWELSLWPHNILHLSLASKPGRNSFVTKRCTCYKYTQICVEKWLLLVVTGRRSWCNMYLFTNTTQCLDVSICRLDQSKLSISLEW